MDEQLKNVSNSNKILNDTAQKPPSKMKGGVTVKKKSGIVKFAEAFLPEDVADVRGYILLDVVIPTVKKIAEEIFHIFLYGASDGGSSRRSSGRTSYQNYYDRRSSSSSRNERSSSRVYVMDYDYIFEFEEDAMDLLKFMRYTIQEQGLVRWSEVNEYLGQTGPWTDTQYGWKSLNGWELIDTHKTGESRYVLKLPKPFPVD